MAKPQDRSNHPWKRGWARMFAGPGKAVLPAQGGVVEANGHPRAVESPEAVLEPPGGPPERILCFPAARMVDPHGFAPGREDHGFSPGAFSGFRMDAPEMATRLFPHGVRYEDFRERTAALEADAAWKQVVAGVAPWHKGSGELWTYWRGGTEPRLTGKLSCLIGGHVRMEDAWPADLLAREDPSALPPVDLLAVTLLAAIREMGEEAVEWEENWKAHHSDTRIHLAGVVNDQHDPAGLCHFGVVYRLDSARRDLPIAFCKDAGRAEGWRPAGLLAQPPADLRVESWSRLVAVHLRDRAVSGSPH